MTDPRRPSLIAEADNPLSIALASRDREVLSLLDHAVAEGSVALAFQPVVRGAAPETVAFHEGLLRVPDGTGRVIPARDFIHLVEARELGRKLDTIALDLGLAALAEEPSLRLAINLSARSVAYPPWTDRLRRGLEADPTVGERLILEITERSAIVMPDLVQVFMKDMQGHGISFALDDFGAGYTAFRYLRDFYFDILKIDGDYVRGIARNPDNQVLCEAMLSVARHFDMFTVAESVESWEDAEFLMDLGVDCLQGYFFGAPTVRPWWREAALRNTG